MGEHEELETPSREVIRRALRLAEDCISDAKAFRDTLIARALGRSIQELDDDPRIVLRLLADADEKVRRACVSYLSRCESNEDEYLAILKRSAIEDPSPAVRATAVAGIGEMNRRATDIRNILFLYNVLRDGEENAKVRKCAYIGIMSCAAPDTAFEPIELSAVSPSVGLDEIVDHARVAAVVRRLGGELGGDADAP